MKKLLSVVLLLSCIGMHAINDDNADSNAFEFTTKTFKVNDISQFVKVYLARRYVAGRKGFTSEEHQCFHLLSLANKSNLEVTCYKDGLFVVKSEEPWGIPLELCEAGFAPTPPVQSLLQELKQKMKAANTPPDDLTEKARFSSISLES